MTIPPPTIPTLTIEELTAALAESLARERKLRAEIANLRAAVNRWQGLVWSLLGNAQRVEKEMQIYLRDGKVPE